MRGTQHGTAVDIEQVVAVDDLEFVVTWCVNHGDGNYGPAIATLVLVERRGRDHEAWTPGPAAYDPPAFAYGDIIQAAMAAQSDLDIEARYARAS